MADETRTSKDRSPNFPYIPLSLALQRAEEFYGKEKRGAAPFPIVASHWRLSAMSSSALQTAAALKAYGLMSDEGRGKARKLRLTELALRIILDNRPDSAEKLTYLRQAAHTPTIAEDIYTLWPDELPSPANLHHYLVLERKFNATTANKAVDIIYKNHELIESNSSVPSEITSAHGGDMPETDRVLSMRSPIPAIHTLGPAVSSSATGVNSSVAFIAERIHIGEAVLTIQVFGQPTAEVFDFLEQYGKFRKGLLKPG